MTFLPSPVNGSSGVHTFILPGFGAGNSLHESRARYQGSATLAGAHDEMVRPEFLGIIKEAAESVGGAVKEAAEAVASGITSAADGLGAEISKLISSIPSGAQAFECRQWAVRMLACNGNQPAFNQVEIMQSCLGPNAEWAAVCSIISVSMYSLVQQACANGNDPGQYLGQVCGGN